MRRWWAQIGPFEQWAVIGLLGVATLATLALWLLQTP